MNSGSNAELYSRSVFAWPAEGKNVMATNAVRYRATWFATVYAAHGSGTCTMGIILNLFFKSRNIIEAKRFACKDFSRLITTPQIISTEMRLE